MNRATIIEITPTMFEAGIAVCNARGLDSKTVTFLRDIFDAMMAGREPTSIYYDALDGKIRTYETRTGKLVDERCAV